MTAADPTADLLALLEQLVNLDSPTADPAACAAVLDLLEVEFTALGAVVTRDRAATGSPVLTARFGAAQPSVLVLGHVDTVFGPTETRHRPFTLDNGYARGPGVFDMKGGLAQLVFALRALRTQGIVPELTVLLNADEEIGSPGSEPFITAAAAGSRCALVVEPAGPGGAVKTARKGMCLYRVDVAGLAAHAGLEPEKGVNAITELARQLLAFEALADPSAGTTVNIGTVTGGTGRNVVPASAAAEFEARFWTSAEAARIDRAVHAATAAHPGATVRVTGGIHRQPLEPTPQQAQLYALARQCAQRAGWELPETRVGGLSDGNLTAALGVPTLDGLGVEGGGAHSVDERVEVACLPRRVALLAELIERLGRAA